MKSFAATGAAVAFGMALSVAGISGGTAVSAKTAATQDSHRIHLGGKVLTITEGGGQQAAPAAKVTFDGKQITGFEDVRVRVYGKFHVEGAKVVVLHVWTGGLSCNGYFQVLHVKDGKLQVSKRLGKCQSGFADMEHGKLYLRFKTYTSSDTYRTETRYVFEDGRLIRIG